MQAERLRAREYGNLAFAGRIPRRRKSRVYRRFWGFPPCAARTADCIKDSRLLDPHTVSGMLLYAATDEAVQPDNIYQMSGNQISVRTLDLNREFSEIAAQLDEIAEMHFEKEATTA